MWYSLCLDREQEPRYGIVAYLLSSHEINASLSFGRCDHIELSDRLIWKIQFIKWLAALSSDCEAKRRGLCPIFSSLVKAGMVHD